MARRRNTSSVVTNYIRGNLKKTTTHDVDFGNSRFKIESRYLTSDSRVYILLDANFVKGFGQDFARLPGYWSKPFATFDLALDEAIRRHEEAGGDFHD